MGGRTSRRRAGHDPHASRTRHDGDDAHAPSTRHDECDPHASRTRHDGDDAHASRTGHDECDPHASRARHDECAPHASRARHPGDDAPSPWTRLDAAPPRGGADPRPWARFEPSSPAMVDEMLRLAEVCDGDVVYDLGCGDGRVVIAAARLGARGVGVDLNPRRLEEAHRNASRAGVTDRVRFLQDDLFTVPLDDATVIMLYLLPSINLRLRPRLRALPQGIRIVSHLHDMHDWLPDRTLRIHRDFLHLWTT